MTTNVHVEKKANENNAALIRRFTRSMQGTKLLRHVRDTRFFQRAFSDNVTKKNKLRRIKRSEEIKRLVKLGKMPDKSRR